MAELAFTEPTGAAPASLTPPENEPHGEIVTAPENSTFQKIRGAVSGVFEKHRVPFKKGRGRPRADGLPGKLDVPLEGQAFPAGTAGVPAPAPTGFDSAMVKRCVSAVVKAAKGFLDRKLWNKAKAATGDSAFASELVKETSITDEELSGFSELAEICLRKYGVGTEYTPEIGVAALLAGIGLRYAVAFKTMDSKLAEKLGPQGN